MYDGTFANPEGCWVSEMKMRPKRRAFAPHRTYSLEHAELQQRVETLTMPPAHHRRKYILVSSDQTSTQWAIHLLWKFLELLMMEVVALVIRGVSKTEKMGSEVSLCSHSCCKGHGPGGAMSEYRRVWKVINQCVSTDPSHFRTARKGRSLTMFI